jgi:hypothetical protein
MACSSVSTTAIQMPSSGSQDKTVNDQTRLFCNPKCSKFSHLIDASHCDGDSIDLWKSLGGHRQDHLIKVKSRPLWSPKSSEFTYLNDNPVGFALQSSNKAASYFIENNYALNWSEFTDLADILHLNSPVWWYPEPGGLLDIHAGSGSKQRTLTGLAFTRGYLDISAE